MLVKKFDTKDSKYNKFFLQNEKYSEKNVGMCIVYPYALHIWDKLQKNCRTVISSIHMHNKPQWAIQYIKN
jgi:hypothetical protein